MIDPQVLAELAMEVGGEDPIDFALLSINERDAYLLMAMHVAERNDEPLVDKAVIVHLLVENMALRMKYNELL